MSSAAKLVTYELEENLAAQICTAVTDSGVAVYFAASTAKCVALVQKLSADIILCSADPDKYRPLLRALRDKGLSVPVVVVSRLPEVSGWLDALESGAADYCSAPFEKQQMRWLIGSVLLGSQQAAA